jgi:hypothetical protein
MAAPTATDEAISASTGIPGGPSRTLGETKVLRYCGDRAFEHHAGNGEPHTSRTYASDKSGTKTYKFNGLGFRGEEPDGRAATRIFVCGASYAFGTGLDWEETWGYWLKAGVARELGLEASRVNLLNFSQSLASSNYITRTLIGQCDAVRPDLVVANYSDMSRAEYFLHGAPVGVLPIRFGWHKRWRVLRPGWRQRLFRLLPGLENRASANERLRMWHHYSGLFSEETAFVNTLTNILLLQSFCQARGIDFLISWVQHGNLRDERFLNNPVVSPLIGLVDRDRFCSFSIVDADLCTDLAADGIHPGASSNREFAERLTRLYMRTRIGAPGRLEAHDLQHDSRNLNSVAMATATTGT